MAWQRKGTSHTGCGMGKCKHGRMWHGDEKQRQHPKPDVPTMCGGNTVHLSSMLA